MILLLVYQIDIKSLLSALLLRQGKAGQVMCRD